MRLICLVVGVHAIKENNSGRFADEGHITSYVQRGFAGVQSSAEPNHTISRILQCCSHRSERAHTHDSGLSSWLDVDGLRRRRWWIDHLRCDEAKLQRGAHEDKPAPGIEAHGE